MKKAKILLTAIGVFTIIGGTLAFKANKRCPIFCSTTAGVAGQCTILVNDLTITLVPQPLKGYCTTNSILSCPIIRQLTVGCG